MKPDRHNAEWKMRKHIHAKRAAIVAHERTVQFRELDRSHYTRWEEQNRLAYIRMQLSFKSHSVYYRRQLKWEWQLTYVKLRMCFRPPLPTEWNRYTHGGYYGIKHWD